MSVKQTLIALQSYLRKTGLVGNITYRGEVSHLMRAANNQISLNASERGSKFFIELQDGKRFSRASVAAGAEDVGTVSAAIDVCAQSLPLMPEIPFATPMEPIAQSDENVSAVDPSFEAIDSRTMEKLFSEAQKRFGPRQTVVSGAFSLGRYEFGCIDTLVERPLFHRGTDYNIELVLQLMKDRKEVRASDVGCRAADFRFEKLFDELDAYLSIKETTERTDLPPGSYDVVFGRDAVAALLMFLTYLSLSGETYEYGMGMLRPSEHTFGDRILGENFTLVDDPGKSGTLFPKFFGVNGCPRKKFPLFTKGVWENLLYSNKLECDRFGRKVNNDMDALNLSMACGTGPSTFDKVIGVCRNPTIFIPFLHYMNAPDGTKGEITASSRFGTFLFENGAVRSHLFNLRLNETLFHIFSRILWLADQPSHANISDTYGLRMASAIEVPSYMCVKDVNITGSSNVEIPD